MVRVFLTAFLTLFAAGLVQPSTAEITAFRQAVAERVAEDDALAAFYRGRDFAPIWTGTDADDLARRVTLIEAFGDAGLHGLPRDRFDPRSVRELLAGVETERDRGAAEVALARLFLDYADAIGSGILEPGRVVAGIKRTPSRPDSQALLTRLEEEPPFAVFASLMPSNGEYIRLLAAKLRLEEAIAAGGWGSPVEGGRLELGDSGGPVVGLRNRLIRMGYLRRTPAPDFDAAMDAAVRRFQAAHGLADDGIVGESTRAALNVSAVERLGQVLVALERERWLNIDRGDRHVWVNLADFSASIIDDGKTTFRTKAVIGARPDDRRSPEFSDEIEHLVVNPTWHVPRSIAVKEYLPQLQQNPGSNGHLQVVYKGQVISRDRVNWSAVTPGNFPFRLKQPPSRSNALGLVKFMFPNRWNIYLHDTPAKSLFRNDVRAFSHGCIRLNKPFEFAYELLARQTDDPRGLFHRTLDTGRETTIRLERHVPVHLVYRTAFTTAKGAVQFREDIYGRDARILRALREAGVALPGAQS